MPRCFGDGNPLYERYHDEEWGFPVRDESGLYERLVLVFNGEDDEATTAARATWSASS